MQISTNDGLVSITDTVKNGDIVPEGARPLSTIALPGIVGTAGYGAMEQVLIDPDGTVRCTPGLDIMLAAEWQPAPTPTTPAA